MTFSQNAIKFMYLLQGMFAKKNRVCPYCRSGHFEIVHTKAFFIDICHCVQCGLYWTNPIFRCPQFYSRVYKGNDLMEIPGPDRLAALMRSNFEGTEADYRGLFEWFRKNLKGRRIMEFGSAWGYFLFQAHQEQFEATGIESSDKKRRFGREHLHVRIEPDLAGLIANRERFDAIVTFHTLEHLTVLERIFKDFYSLLEPGGILFIVVPFLDPAGGKKAFEIMGAVHPIGFSREFFVRNMPQEGFRVSFLETAIVCTKEQSDVG